MMQRTTQSVLFAAAFLALAELGLRRAERIAPAAGGLSSERPIVLLLGTSRTQFAIRPGAVERTLAAEGVVDPWVANVIQRGATFVGLYQFYADEIHPLVARNRLDALLGIEVRGASFNDAHLEVGESRALPALAAGGPDVLPPGPGALLASGRFDEAARALFGELSLMQGREHLWRTLRRLWSRPGDRAGPTDGDWVARVERSRAWANDEKGWSVFTIPRRPDLNVDQRRRKHEKRLLRDYRTGGVQTTALRQLVRDARADGLRPFLYALPVTELHRAFFEDDGYAAFLAHAERIAAEEGVPFVDLDTGHALTHDAFHDTDHLHRSAARGLSARFAREAVRPLLGD